MNSHDLTISEFAELCELTCDYVISEFIVDDVFTPVFPEFLNNDQPKVNQRNGYGNGP